MKLYKEGNLKTIIHLWEKEVRNQWSQFPFKKAKKNKINLKERAWKGIVMIKRIKTSWEDVFYRVSWFIINLLQSCSGLLVQGEANRPMWSRVQKHVMKCGQNHSDPQSRREREVFPINVAGSTEYQYGKKWQWIPNSNFQQTEMHVLNWKATAPLGVIFGHLWT